MSLVLSPIQGGTQSITPTSSSQTITITANNGGQFIHVLNSSDTVCHVAMDGSDATTSDFPVEPGASEILDAGEETSIRVISSGTPTGDFYLSTLAAVTDHS